MARSYIVTHPWKRACLVLPLLFDWELQHRDLCNTCLVLHSLHAWKLQRQDLCNASSIRHLLPAECLGRAVQQSQCQTARSSFRAPLRFTWCNLDVGRSIQVYHHHASIVMIRCKPFGAIALACNPAIILLSPCSLLMCPVRYRRVDEEAIETFTDTFSCCIRCMRVHLRVVESACRLWVWSVAGLSFLLLFGAIREWIPTYHNRLVSPLDHETWNSCQAHAISLTRT